MPGPTKKSNTQRRNKPSAPDLRLLDGEAFVPAPPESFTETEVEAWSSFWRTDLARSVMTALDVPAVERLFWLYDQEETLKNLIDKNGRMVPGSQGQPVLHPAYRQLNATLAQIRDLEDRFGTNPRSRLSLGIALGQLRRNLSDLTADLTIPKKT